MNLADRANLVEWRQSARRLLRDIGFVAQAMDSGNSELRGNVLMAYDQACEHLRLLDPIGAAEFIKQTYGPSLRFTK